MLQALSIVDPCQHSQGGGEGVPTCKRCMRHGACSGCPLSVQLLLQDARAQRFNLKHASGTLEHCQVVASCQLTGCQIHPRPRPVTSPTHADSTSNTSSSLCHLHPALCSPAPWSAWLGCRFSISFFCSAWHCALRLNLISISCHAHPPQTGRA